MKIKTQLLAEALKDLKPIISTTGQIQILSCVKIVTGDQLEIVATDGDQMASRSIEFNGEVNVLAVNFNQLLFSLGDAEETNMIRDNGVLIVKCGQKVSRIGILDTKDFPEAPDQSKFKAIGVNCADLAKGIRAVHGFEHKDRDALTGLLIRGSPKLLECIATDGANLAHWTLPSISAEFECLIPADFADALAGALERENAVFKLSNNQAFVEWNGGFYVCKLSELKFPSITAITGNKFDRLGKLTTRPLLRECEACIALTNQAMTAALDLEFMADGLFTRFGGTNENHFTGDFKPAYKCTVNAKSAKLCLGAIGETCEFFGNKVATKMVNCDLTIYSTLMLAH